MGGVLVKHEPVSAGLVRHRLAHDLGELALEAASIDDVVLVAGELIGNAIRHTDATTVENLDVRWRIDGAEVTVSVADSSRRAPERRAADPLDAGGRGLNIVEAIAAEWGVETTDTGKTVWARVPVRRRRPS